MDWLITTMRMNICGEIAGPIIALCDRNLYVPSMNLFELSIVRDIIHRLKSIICDSVVDSCEELAKLL
jgi:phosphoenolpyruvate-protein kinase (PTS system EI component)